YGKEHAEVGYALANFGSHWQLRGRHAQAAALLGRALRVQERALGARHPSVGLTLYNLAALDVDLGRRSDALAKLRRAQRILQRALGERHAHTRAARALLREASAPQESM